MAFTHSQAQAFNNVLGASTSLIVTLTNNPAAGDVVCLGGVWSDGTANPPASYSIADSNSNAYTRSTNSPLTTNNQSAYAYYLNNAPANATKTITASYSNTGGGGYAEVVADDFAVSGGTSAFDQDAKASGTGTSPNTPTLTVSGSNELAWFYITSQNGVTSVDSPWTQSGITSSFSNASGYILSRSTNVAVAATQNNGTWDNVALSFSFSASGGGGITATQLHAYQRGARRAFEKGRR